MKKNLLSVLFLFFATSSYATSSVETTKGAVESATTTDSKTEKKETLKIEKKVTFPQVLSWKNNPDIELEQKKKAELKTDLQMKTAFKVVTGPQDEVLMQFHGGEKIMVMPQSKVLVPQVSPDSGEVSEVQLLDGTIRFTTDSAMSRSSKLRVKSPFFDLSLPADLDVFISVDLRQPSTRFQVIKGEMTAMFFDFEKTQHLKAGDAVTFTGEREGEGIKYDMLLNSRKAPRGVLHQVEKFDFQGYLAQEKVKNEAHSRELAKKNKELELKKKKQKNLHDSFLCKSPYGQKDQCYWKVQDGKCFRYRCNVSGQWGDETERPMTDLCTQNKAKTCDY